MTFDDLIKEIQDIPPEIKAVIDVEKWIHRHTFRSYPILTFEQTGRAIRAVLPIIGKPYSHNPIEGWFRTYQWSSFGVTKPPEGKFPEAFKVLDKLKIGFNGWNQGYLAIDTLLDVYPSAFYTSDDPVVWKVRNQRRIDSKHLRQVEKKLDGE